MADATRRKRAQAKPKPEGGETGTDYVVLDQVEQWKDSQEFIDAVADGRVWVERPALARGGRGEDAIKHANLLPDGSHQPGTFKAVPGSTWNAESNNLGILAEQKIVNTFRRGAGKPLPAEPEPTPEPRPE